MSTLTPTNKPADSPPTGFPDEATLAQLATELFRMLPNGTSAGECLPGSVSSLRVTPDSARREIPSAPKLTPTAITPTGVPDTIAQSAPAVDGRAGSLTLGVPEAYAAALPTVTAPPEPTADSPYYFLGEPNAYGSSKSPTPQVPTFDDRVTVQPFGLPGAEQLDSILAGISLGYGREPEPKTLAAPPDANRHFYFVDPLGAETRAVPSVSQKEPAPFDVHPVRRDFPALHQKVHGKPLIWLDSAATSQKPQTVIDAISYFYEHDNSNIHRAAHALAARATDAYEGARQKIQRFIGASSSEEIVFVRGATEAMNLLAQTCGRQRIGPGDEIILTQLEHHANIVPWQFLAKEKGAVLKVVPITDSGEVLLDEYAKLLGPRTRIVSLAHVSNTLGTVLPIELMAAMAHAIGATVIIDGAQSIPHLRIDVKALDCDFFVFSGHKLFGPTGIGALYGKKHLLDQLPPWQGGGNMIEHVTFEHTTFNKTPYKFEAGTGHIAGAVGLGAAIDYLDRIGWDAAIRYEDGLLAYATQGLETIPGLRLFGTAPHKVGTVSFVLDGIRPEDVGKFLDQEGIAVRAGHHCAQPTMQRFNVTGMVRPSLAFYNTYQEINVLVAAVYKAKKALA